MENKKIKVGHTHFFIIIIIVGDALAVSHIKKIIIKKFLWRLFIVIFIRVIHVWFTIIKPHRDINMRNW